MTSRFEELAWSPTDMGDLCLRRRRDPVVGIDVYEVKLGDDFLMSSLFTVAEVAIARLAIAELDGEHLDVAVGGLGLGYTAQAVLEDPRVSSLVVIEKLDEVIDWHQRGLLPASRALLTDSRCRFVSADFFALAASTSLDPAAPKRRFDAVIVDIDHSPSHLLHPGHHDFYTPEGVSRMAARLRPGGVFALWSNDPPDDTYVRTLEQSFVAVRAEVVVFDNPLQGRDAANTVYLARTTNSEP